MPKVYLLLGVISEERNPLNPYNIYSMHGKTILGFCNAFEKHNVSKNPIKSLLALCIMSKKQQIAEWNVRS